MSAYRPPNRDVSYAQNLCQAVRDLIIKYPSCTFWLSGDFNLPDIDWATDSIVGHQYPLAINNTFISTFQDLGLTQIVDFPTRIDRTLDLFLSNRPSLVSKCSPLPGVSDHEMVLVVSDIRAKRQKPVPRKILLWKKADICYSSRLNLKTLHPPSCLRTRLVLQWTACGYKLHLNSTKSWMIMCQLKCPLPDSTNRGSIATWNVQPEGRRKPIRKLEGQMKKVIGHALKISKKPCKKTVVQRTTPTLMTWSLRKLMLTLRSFGHSWRVNAVIIPGLHHLWRMESSRATALPKLISWMTNLCQFLRMKTQLTYLTLVRVHIQRSHSLMLIVMEFRSFCLRSSLTQQQALMVYQHICLKRGHLNWLQSSLCSFNLLCIRVRSHMIGNLPTWHPSSKKGTTTYLQTIVQSLSPPLSAKQ